MNWLKSSWAALLAAAAMFFAAMAVAKARREKASADKWKEQAVKVAEADVVDKVASAKIALAKAKTYDKRATEAKETARAQLDKVGKRDEDMAAIVSGWKSSRLRDSTDT